MWLRAGRDGVCWAALRRASGLATAVPVAVTGVLVLWAATSLAIGDPSSFRCHAAEIYLLPAFVLGIASSGALARVLQSGLEENRHAPFVSGGAGTRHWTRTPDWPGMPLDRRFPLAISFLALEASLLLGGTVVTEMVFARTGLGRCW